MLLAVPNLSEGRDRALVERLAAQFATGVALLDVHVDAIHNRAVLTLAGEPPRLAHALAAGAHAAFAAIDVGGHQGAHPRVGALDVCPLVWLHAADREAAAEQARALAADVAAAGVPVFLYGGLAASDERRERAYFREGGLERLRERMDSGELRPDLGPPAPHPGAGATLVTARPPLAAFNLELEGIDLEGARGVAARLRESGGGLSGVRAIGIDLGRGRTQVSTNVHDPVAVPLAAVIERAGEIAAEHDARVVATEVVGLVPAAALAGFPRGLEVVGPDPHEQTIERRLSRAPG